MLNDNIAMSSYCRCSTFTKSLRLLTLVLSVPSFTLIFLPIELCIGHPL